MVLFMTEERRRPYATFWAMANRSLMFTLNITIYLLLLKIKFDRYFNYSILDNINYHYVKLFQQLPFYTVKWNVLYSVCGIAFPSTPPFVKCHKYLGVCHHIHGPDVSHSFMLQSIFSRVDAFYGLCSFLLVSSCLWIRSPSNSSAWQKLLVCCISHCGPYI